MELVQIFISSQRNRITLFRILLILEYESSFIQVSSLVKTIFCSHGDTYDFLGNHGQSS